MGLFTELLKMLRRVRRVSLSWSFEMNRENVRVIVYSNSVQYVKSTVYQKLYLCRWSQKQDHLQQSGTGGLRIRVVNSLSHCQSKMEIPNDV